MDSIPPSLSVGAIGRMQVHLVLALASLWGCNWLEE